MKYAEGSCNQCSQKISSHFCAFLENLSYHLEKYVSSFSISKLILFIKSPQNLPKVHTKYAQTRVGTFATGLDLARLCTQWVEIFSLGAFLLHAHAVLFICHFINFCQITFMNLQQALVREPAQITFAFRGGQVVSKMLHLLQ